MFEKLTSKTLRKCLPPKKWHQGMNKWELFLTELIHTLDKSNCQRRMKLQILPSVQCPQKTWYRN